MAIEAKHSLMNRTGLTLAFILFLSILNIIISFLTAETAENDAVRINIAGSLRMQSYRIAEALIIEDDPFLNSEGSNLLEQEITRFEDRLYAPVLIDHLRKSRSEKQVESIRKLEDHWQILKNRLHESRSSPYSKKPLLQEIDSFVLEIDHLVKELERQTESKFRILRVFQGISLLITLIIVVVGILDISSNVVMPLNRMVEMAQKVRKGDFSMRLDVNSEDELSILAQAFNEMATSIEATYQNLEEKVKEKTLHLEKAHDEIALRYSTSQILHASQPLPERIEKTLLEIGRFFSARNVVAELAEENCETVLLSAHEHHASYAASEHLFPIVHQGKKFGVIKLLLAKGELLEPKSKRLLQDIADKVATAISANRRLEQERRISLMEERAVIARELHDSLAQSLAYLKIQISRLQKQQEKSDSKEELLSTISHIKTGIGTAYSQLRELLTTFRLTLPSGGLQEALHQTVKEFSQRSDIEISLEYQIANCPLTPNEEIHLLQIIRESLANVVHHSRARNAGIYLFPTANNRITLSVVDNGIGFSEEGNKPNHYGKTIMRERAKTLQGEISFSTLVTGGAEVKLAFTPSFARKQAETRGQGT